MTKLQFVLGVLVASLAMEAFIIGVGILLSDDANILSNIVKSVLCLLLIFYLRRGSETARVLGAIIFGLGATLGILVLAPVSDQTGLVLFTVFVWLPLLGVCTYFLGFSKSVKADLKNRARAYAEKNESVTRKYYEDELGEKLD